MKTVGRAGGGPPETISLETKYLHLRQPVPLGQSHGRLAGLLAGRLGQTAGVLRGHGGAG